jgi:hypothetical protein
MGADFHMNPPKGRDADPRPSEQALGPIPGLDDMAVMLQRKRTELAAKIHQAQGQRNLANEAIRDARAELADVERMLNARKPRRGKRAG